jgi:hypothetical protein
MLRLLVLKRRRKTLAKRVPEPPYESDGTFDDELESSETFHESDSSEDEGDSEVYQTYQTHRFRHDVFKRNCDLSEKAFISGIHSLCCKYQSVADSRRIMEIPK